MIHHACKYLLVGHRLVAGSYKSSVNLELLCSRLITHYWYSMASHTSRARKCRSTEIIVCAVGSSPVRLGITSGAGAGESRSTEIIMSVVPSYGAI
jgi:hypothetical protein